MSIERGVVKFLLEMELPLQITLVLFHQNVPDKHKNSEWNSVIGFLNLKANNSGRHNRFGYLSEKQYGHDVTDVRRVIAGGIFIKG